MSTAATSATLSHMPPLAPATLPVPTAPTSMSSPTAATTPATAAKLQSPHDPPELCWPWNGQATVLGFLRDTVLVCILLAAGRAMFGLTLDTLRPMVEDFSGLWREVAAYWFDRLPRNDPGAGFPLLSAVATSGTGILCLLFLVLIFSIATGIFAVAFGLVTLLHMLFAVALGVHYLTYVLETNKVVSSDPTPPASHTRLRALWVTPIIPLTIRILLALLPVRFDSKSCAVIYTASTGAYLVWWAGRQTGAVKLQVKEAEGQGKNE
ncbi:hypothetical protein NBRC10512_006887 [Rhodotorula toruloides]|uniref:RHTO0S11e06524g1_1 n=2 Tax=Rhodotorula toruloides TaxID=5286 RepID=A0A061B7Q6_RHOTO|nr:uncharacterized protein RHTO_01580 [Rhodotorula toruloides NP11]EMS21520.1 hypothetical protein RHTO_01580 [Rhodotorula toruloides NP11]CDR45940.1 RHTO0S11e06524g1_1 [Rhodotorula toruloides]